MLVASSVLEHLIAGSAQLDELKWRFSESETPKRRATRMTLNSATKDVRRGVLLTRFARFRKCPLPSDRFAF